LKSTDPRRKVVTYTPTDGRTYVRNCSSLYPRPRLMRRHINLKMTTMIANTNLYTVGHAYYAYSRFIPVSSFANAHSFISFRRATPIMTAACRKAKRE